MNEVTAKNYVQHVLRTEPKDFEPIKERLTEENIRLLHAAMGLVTEAGEFLDALKKHLFYGKPLDKKNLVEELGDGNWYEGLAIDVLNSDLESILRMNIEKLKKRYPGKFSEQDAVNRDVDKELEHIEITKVSNKQPEWELVVKYRWWREDDHIIQDSELEDLEEEGLEQVLDKIDEGYTSGELIDNHFGYHRGHWELVRRRTK